MILIEDLTDVTIAIQDTDKDEEDEEDEEDESYLVMKVIKWWKYQWLKLSSN